MLPSKAMRLRPPIPTGFLLLLALLSSPAAAVVADRILAVVNNEVIALNDVRIYRELFEEKPEADDPAVLNDLVDQALLLAEARKLEVPPPSDDEVAQAYKKLRLRFGKAETFELVKTRLSLTDADVEQHLRLRLQAEHLIEQRIQFFVFVTPEEIEDYYQARLDDYKHLSPEDAQKAVQDLLIKEKSKSKLKDYLDRLRAKANIRISRPLPE